MSTERVARGLFFQLVLPLTTPTVTALLLGLHRGGKVLVIKFLPEDFKKTGE